MLVKYSSPLKQVQNFKESYTLALNVVKTINPKP
jgi:hypothetical protein